MISIITPTHDPVWIAETYASVVRQTSDDFEWVIFLSCEKSKKQRKSVEKIVGGDKRVRIEEAQEDFHDVIGAIKKAAFSHGRGDALIELDHDDLLAPNAVAEVTRAFDDPTVDFVYSNFADFNLDGSPSTYGELGALNGWEYRDTVLDGKKYKEAVAWEPTAASLSLIFFAPNHLRAWRRSFYEKIGGHDTNWPICDDHELLIRTYLHGRMKRIDSLLYLYRMGANTFSERTAEIDRLTHQLYAENIEKLVWREMVIRNLPCIDLGGAFNCPDGWISVDIEGAAISADLSRRWPFEDGSVGAFRAFDFLEHLPDKMHVMAEIHRCLAPGGWLLSFTPSALGQGGHCDPTHLSQWVPLSFSYYTDREVAKYIRNFECRFMQKRIVHNFPSAWHEQNVTPYITADLIALKDGMRRLPGLINI